MATRGAAFVPSVLVWGVCAACSPSSIVLFLRNFSKKAEQQHGSRCGVVTSCCLGLLASKRRHVCSKRQRQVLSVMPRWGRILFRWLFCFLLYRRTFEVIFAFLLFCIEHCSLETGFSSAACTYLPIRKLEGRLKLCSRSLIFVPKAKHSLMKICFDKVPTAWVIAILHEYPT